MVLPRLPSFIAASAGALLLAQAATAGNAAQCQRSSGPQRATVVELYTSEGCSSCPPADRWLSSLPPGGDVVALAFHVDYWDRLGWTDRFASPAYTERQAQQQKTSGARFVYTPQVLVDGRDWRGWPGLPAAGTPAAVQIRLQRDGNTVLAQVSALRSAALPARLAAWWAVVEDGQVSQVKAGENSGATLHHDHVVRRYQPVAAWTSAQPQQLRLDAPQGGHAQRVVLVVTDAASGRPLQALELGC